MLGDRFQRYLDMIRVAGLITSACVKAMDRGCNTGDILRSLAHAAPLHPARVGPFVAQPVVVVPPQPIAAHSGDPVHPCSNAQFATCHPAQKLERLKEGVKLLSQELQRVPSHYVEVEEVRGALDLLLLMHR